ncbi:hypothetical protein VKT23_007884 [Stygiomarasmius scandens]|uniref:F-box domain-containing protein n=1 Tax=Marasmiellus scandens TaxID=2682957 RepID=A0ABR1JIP3_9AGAR
MWLRLEPGDTLRIVEERETNIVCQERHVSRLEAQIQSVRAQTEVTRQFATHSPSLPSPIRRLPNELLVEILSFECGPIRFFTRTGYKIPIYDNRGLLHSYASNRIFELLAVCTHWRDIIVFTPTLWSNLSLHLDYPSNFGRKVLTTLEKLLRRSAGAPLTLVLGGVFDSSYRGKEFFSALAHHSHRWQSFAWSVFWAEDTEMYDVAPQSLPLLQSLEVGYRLSSFVTSSILNWTNLSEIILGTFDDKSELPWSQITKLGLIEKGIDPQLYRALGCFPNVQTLSIRFSDLPFRNGKTLIPIVDLERLHTFTISNILLPCSDVFVALFSSLTAHMLTTLSLSAVDLRVNERSSSLPLDSVTSFLLRSRCRLLHLTLENFHLKEDELVSLLQLTPFLVTLRIMEPNPPQDASQSDRKKCNILTEGLLHQLIGLECTPKDGENPSDSPTLLLPNLERLYITVNGATFEDQSFARMVKSRWIPKSSMSEVEMKCLRFVEVKLRGRRMDDIARKELDSVRKAGMVVSLLDEVEEARS